MTHSVVRPCVAITGAGGILGRELLSSGAVAGAVGIAHRSDAPGASFRVDLRDRAATESTLDEIAPTAIVHTVALTDVDRCQESPSDAYATNVLTTLHLAEWVATRRPETLLVYISSDQVYSGNGPHAEAPVAPLNVYGSTKHAGELAARVAPQHLVVRTNFVGRSASRPSYTDWIARAASRRAPISIDPRAVFSPLHTSDLATLIGTMIERQVTGCFNLAASTSIRKADFARAVIAGYWGEPGEIVQEVELEDAGRAPRALDLALDVRAAERRLEESLPTSERCVELVVSEYREGAELAT